jgi:hypothetical protein
MVRVIAAAWERRAKPQADFAGPPQAPPANVREDVWCFFAPDLTLLAVQTP